MDIYKKPHKDKLPGGLADKKKPEDFDPEALRQGVEIELEHTDDPELALEVAMDHLVESGSYYKDLKDMERKNEKKAHFRPGELAHHMQADFWLNGMKIQ